MLRSCPDSGEEKIQGKHANHGYFLGILLWIVHAHDEVCRIQEENQELHVDTIRYSGGGDSYRQHSKKAY